MSSLESAREPDATTGAAGADEPRTTVCPHGPLLVRGASEWPTADGGTAAVTRPVVAVCRCARSQRMPWCDGTHKVVPKGWDQEADSSSALDAGRRQPRAVR